MGFFKKKHKDESEDFILSFNSFQEQEKEISEASDTDTAPDEGITPWDKRHHATAPHAMTVEEILGKPAKEEKTKGTESTDNQDVLSQTDDDIKAPSSDLPKLSLDVPNTEKDEEPTEVIKETETFAETSKEQASESTEKERIVIPQDEEPIFEKADGHAETEEIFATSEKEKQENDNFDEYIKSIKAQSLRNYGIEMPNFDPTPAKAQDTAQKAVQDATETSKESVADDTADAQAPAQTSEPAQESQSAPKKGTTQLSPMAQQLYDRMMAERAKSTLRKEHISATADIADTEQTDVAENSESTADTDVAFPNAENAQKAPEQSQSEKEQPVAPVPQKTAENIADAIFESLNDNLFKAPLSHHGIGDSLLDKCKSFVKKEPAYHESIDDIIHDAEKSARERLFKIEKETEQKYDFGMFSQDVPTDVKEDLTTPDTDVAKVDETLNEDTDAPQIKIDKKTSIFESGDNESVKNLQYSLADEDVDPDLTATRRIDITLDKDEANNIELNAESGRRAAPEKIEEIKLHLEKLAEKDPTAEFAHLNLTGEEEAQLPENDVKSFEEDIPVLDDYNSIDDLDSVNTDLTGKKVSVTAKLLPTALITAVLFIINCIFREMIITASATAFTWLNLILFAAVFAINFNTVKGIAGLVMGTPDMDTPYALSATGTLIYTFVTTVTNTTCTLPTLTTAGAIALLFNLIGKYSIIKRVSRGFKVIANNRIKNAVTFVEDKLSASVMASGSVIGEALICEGKPTTNVTNYLNNSYSEDAYEKKVTPLVIFTVIAAAVVAVLAVIMGNDIYTALFAFALVCVVACPVSAILVCNLPLGFASKNLKNYGAMIAGYNGADTIANANAVAFSAQQLFPEGTIKLYHIQVLSSCVVDEYVGYAAGVLKAANSPLTPVFTEILETIDREAPFADSIKCENGMGVSGWVEDKHIFIGNRTLMEGHNIHTPSLELDKKILRQGFFPLYFAIDQQLYALFIIGYEADEEITYHLRQLCSSGVTMLVNSNDPNITDEMLCDYFGLYENSIKVLSPSGVTAYNTVNQYKDSVSAPAAYGDDINGFLATVSSAIKIKSISSILLIMQIVFICLGVGAVGYLTITSAVLKIPSLVISAVQLGCAAITALVAKFNQP